MHRRMTSFNKGRAVRLLLPAAVLVLLSAVDRQTEAAPRPFEPVKPAGWVHGVARMAFCTPGEIPDAVAAGAQVVQTNINWPYYPLRKDGGRGASDAEAKLLCDAVEACHSKGAKLV